MHWKTAAMEAKIIRQSLKDEQLSPETLNQVIEIVQECGALNYTRERAESQTAQAQECLNTLPSSEYRDALELMLTFSNTRST